MGVSPSLACATDHTPWEPERSLRGSVLSPVPRNSQLGYVPDGQQSCLQYGLQYNAADMQPLPGLDLQAVPLPTPNCIAQHSDLPASSLRRMSNI